METEPLSQPESERFVKLAVEAPLDDQLTYKTTAKWPIGSSVIAPLGHRKVSAVLIDEGIAPPDVKIREIISLNENRPTLTTPYLEWLKWISDYYVYPLGQVAALCFPPLEKKESTRRSSRRPVIQESIEAAPAPTLTVEQKTCVDSIKSHYGFQTHLVYGVTGSGKTEVYLRLLEDVLSRGQRGLVLVPEISLTPQLIQRFASRFGDQIAVIHSHLTNREKTDQWWSMVSGQKNILIGARSALFCPIENLGIIIIDEEHEPSYKQEEKLRYNARDAAIVLAKKLDIPIVLGSATPSLETWFNAQSGKYHLHRMSSRVADRKLPQIEIVDLRASKKATQEESNFSGSSSPLGTSGLSDKPRWMSKELYEKTVAALNRGHQVAFFLNRRGVAPSVLCQECGWVYQCPNCAITLTLHGQRNLVCHYCDYAHILDRICPSCKNAEPQSVGLGTEKLESDLQLLFPNKTIARADRDEIHSRAHLEDLISRMENQEIDILVGTQMIAKGLDFKGLTLVGLVLADVGFNMPDFRSTERSFQLITQVCGRSGRHVADGGHVVIQTYNPEYPALKFVHDSNYDEFAKSELDVRQELLYPPFGKLATLKIIATSESRGNQVAEDLVNRCQTLIDSFESYKDIAVLGPTTAPLAKVRGKFRFLALLKSPHGNILSKFCRHLLTDRSWIPSGTKVQVDIDPINLL